MGFFFNQRDWKNTIHRFVILAIIIGYVLIRLIMLLVNGIGVAINGKPIDNYREYIVDKKYDKAKEYAEDHDLYVKDVIAEQTNRYMKQGDFSAAQNLCAQTEQIYIYFHSLTSNIQSLYDDHGARTIALAFSMVPYPSPTSQYVTDDFKKQWGLADTSSYRDYREEIVSENNRAIETLGNYMKAKGNTNGLNQILEYLQPSYEKGQPVYDDIIRIKMKFE